MNDHIAIIGTVGVPANYGGFETLVDNLLDDDAHQFTVYCSRQAYTEHPTRYKNARLVYLPLKANGIQSIPYDILSILHAITTGHRRILVLGVSGAIILPVAKLLFPRVNIITNIDGLEWKRDKWSPYVKTLLQFFEKMAVLFSDHVVCDNPEILRYVQSQYHKEGHYIAYGGDHALTNTCSRNSSDFFLSICRIEPENNIHTILKAFSGRNEKIIFVGNWDSSDYGKNLRQQYSAAPNMQLLDPVYDKERLFKLRDQGMVYVHGHSAGGTNPSLVEVMHFSKPILAFDCAYNRATLQNQGIFFTDAASLQHLLSNKAWTAIDTARVSAIAQKFYTWETVRRQYSQLFDRPAAP